jgi:hypothetical protein
MAIQVSERDMTNPGMSELPQNEGIYSFYLKVSPAPATRHSTE